MLKKYPKLVFFLSSCLFAYVLFETGYFDAAKPILRSLGYLSAFIGGLLFSLGFSSPFAVGIFIEISQDLDPSLAALIAGAGAFIVDTSIFRVSRSPFFLEEWHRVKASPFIQHIHALLHHERISERLRSVLMWTAAGIVIASPLPDEIGVSLVSGLTNIDSKRFGLLCFALNTLGVFIILLLAR